MVRVDGAPLTFADLQTLREACDAGDLLEEPEANLCALGLNAADALPDAYQPVQLRFYLADQDEAEILRASRAKALLDWHDNSRFCSHCGHQMDYHRTQTARLCPQCGRTLFPRIDPCIILLIRRDDRILLLRHAARNTNIYACLAGFIEAGETAEHAVEREVMEETGLKVRNIRYFGSQSWPFPSQLMLAFNADWESGELSLQDDEIADAIWVRPDEIEARGLQTPPRGSIAYCLIEAARKAFRNESHA